MNDRGRSTVAIILAIALGTAVNIIVIAVLYDAIFSEGPGLSDNATQILTGAFGGIIGVLGSYVGFVIGRATASGEAVPAELSPPQQEQIEPE